MSNEQLTDAQISERVCKALGIEGRAGCYCSSKCMAPVVMGRQTPCLRDVKVYPNILDGAGFLLVVERLRDKEIRWDHMALPNGTWGMALFDSQKHAWAKCAYADTLPRALAYAVLEWEASRGGVE